jgi:thymidylate synthase
MRQYLDLLREVYELDEPFEKNRTNIRTKSVFGKQLRFNLKEGFPIITTKKIHFKSIVHELLWFLSGSTNIKYLQDNNVRIWDEWADSYGDVGPIYGFQWTNWNDEGINQISRLIRNLKSNPESRRHVVSAWNPSRLEEMALPPCHMMFQCLVKNNQLSMIVTQRSADLFLGVPFNISSYALLLEMIAQQTELEAHELIWNGASCHIYENSLEAIEKQLTRKCLKLPRLELRKRESIFDYKYEDIKLIGYESWPALKVEVAV